MIDGGPTSSWADEAVGTIFEASPAGEPYTSREVADELGCARTTAYKKLQREVESGTLQTKKVGARGRVWWAPPTATTPDPDDDRSYEEVLAAERQFRAVFEEAFDAILIADDDARYVDVNPAACELFGLPREDLLGRTIADFAAEGYDFQEAWQDFQESELDRGLFPLTRADGEQRIVEFAATPNILPGRHLSVLRDVTERRETKTKLERERDRSQQYQRTLAADVVIELEIRMADDAVLGALSNRLDCACEFEGLVPTSDGRWLHYVTVESATSETICSTAAALPAVNDCRVVFESDGTTLVELALDRSPITTLVEAGASGRSMRSDGGVTTVVAEIGADADLQRLINAFTTEYPEAEVVAKRTLNRPVVTTQQYRASLANSLTERQTETLRAAYLAGYFEWPRNSHSEALAASMGVATSTWLRHLRLAESKLVRWFFQELEG